MDKQTDLEGKYQKLATEYSKVRSHATVLKKAVLDEQAKAVNLKEIIKTYEQQMRKHEQEMESLTFRNEQLTKRIYVLQEELRVTQHGKKGKNKAADNNVQSNFNILDEELQKKILENAQLASTLADKDIELSNNIEKIAWLEDKIDKLQENLVETETKYKERIEQINQEIKNKECELNSNSVNKSEQADKEKQAMIEQLQAEVTRWKTQCDLISSKPTGDEALQEYYERKLEELLELKQIAESETRTLWIENDAMTCRLEKLISEKNALEKILEKSNEELHTTSENYKMQLDAMTEHVAAQNETVTKLSDEIEILKHKLSIKK